MQSGNSPIDELLDAGYEYGFVTDIASDTLPPGLDETTVRAISAKKNEPEWLLEWRLKAFRHWLTMEEPEWAHINKPKIDFQAISYYSAPNSMKDAPESLDDIDPEIRKTYDKLGIPIVEQMALAGIAVDAVFDSVSVATTFRKKLAESGVIFSSISEAVHDHPELVRENLGSVVSYRDNFFACLLSLIHISEPTRPTT